MYRSKNCGLWFQRIEEVVDQQQQEPSIVQPTFQPVATATTLTTPHRRGRPKPKRKIDVEENMSMFKRVRLLERRYAIKHLGNLAFNFASVQLEADFTAYLSLPVRQFHTDDDLLEHYGSAIPNSKKLEALLKRLGRLVDVLEDRGVVSDNGMRMLAHYRKERLQEIETERRDVERMAILKRGAADEEEPGRNEAKRSRRAFKTI
jgi:hypothetical protein